MPVDTLRRRKVKALFAAPHRFETSSSGGAAHPGPQRSPSHTAPQVPEAPRPSEIRQTLKLALPLVGAQLLTMSMPVVDNLVVARLGARPLAAMAMACTLDGSLFVLALGLLSAVSPMVSKLVGARQPARVGRTVHNGLFLGAVMAAMMMVVFSYSDHILLALGQDPSLVPLARQFLLAASWGAPGVTGFMALRQLTEGVSDTRPSLVIAASTALLYPFFETSLVYGRFGIPALGLPGAGYALAVANWFMFGLLLAYVWFKSDYRQYHFWSRGEPGQSMGDLVRLGLPVSGSLLSGVTFFGATTLMMGWLGAQSLAAHQIALGVCSFAIMVPMGLSTATAIRLGQATGAGDLETIRRIGRSSAVATCVWQCCTAALFLSAAPRIVGLYTSDLALVAAGARLLRIGGVFQLFDGLQNVGMGMLRGVLDTRVPFIAAFLSYSAIGVGCSAWLGLHCHWGAEGVWYGMVLGLGCAAVLHQWRFHWVTADRARLLPGAVSG